MPPPLLPHPQIIERPKARFVSASGADPRGPTMLSAPPVNNSLLADRPSQLPQPTKHKVLTYGALGVAGFLVIWLAFLRSPHSADKPPEPAAPVGAASTPAAQPPAAPSSVASTGAPPAATQAPSATSKAHRTAVPHTGAAPRAPDDESLFSGRK